MNAIVLQNLILINFRKRKKIMIAIIDLGIGNISSVANIVKKAGGEFCVCKDRKELSKCTKIIMPGVGAFDRGVSGLIKGDWIEALNESVLNERKKVLGICLGMQLMCHRSEEGQLEGLGWIDADVKRFNFSDIDATLKIPHMGWNSVKVENENDLLLIGDEEKRFYFVHSYHVVCHKAQDILSTTHYGRDFTSAFCHDNVYGVQFHPEKSHRFGVELIKRFIQL